MYVDSKNGRILEKHMSDLMCGIREPGTFTVSQDLLGVAKC